MKKCVLLCSSEDTVVIRTLHGSSGWAPDLRLGGDKTALGVVIGMVLRETAKLHTQCWDSICIQIKD